MPIPKNSPICTLDEVQGKPFIRNGYEERVKARYKPYTGIFRLLLQAVRTAEV